MDKTEKFAHRRKRNYKAYGNNQQGRKNQSLARPALEKWDFIGADYVHN